MEGPGLRERRVAAVVGALVADASAQPIHWNYDVKKLDALLAGSTSVGFWEPASNPFYRLPCGSQSCYGDQSFVILKSLVENQGLDVRKLTQDTYDWFGPESAYEDPANKEYKEKQVVGDRVLFLSRVSNSEDLVENQDIEKKKSFPIHRPWRHFSIKDFLKNVQAGKEDTGSESDSQIDCVLRVVSVVALYAGRPEMLDRAEAVIRVTQNSDTSVAVGLAAARLLEQFILNGPCEDAVDNVIKQLSDAKRDNPQDLDRAQSAVHGVIAAKDYITGVQETLRAGGCNASRGGFVGACQAAQNYFPPDYRRLSVLEAAMPLGQGSLGACIAAQHGLSSIPEDWKRKTLRYEETLDLAQKLVEINLH